MGALVFRVDAGAEIGIGHLQRCLSLAAACARKQDTIFVVNDDPRVRDRVRDAGWAVVSLACPSWSSDDAATVMAAAEGSGASVVVDSDLEPPPYIRRLRAAGLYVCCIEDNGHDEMCAHLLVNGDVHAHEQRYHAPFAQSVALLGPSYSLLGEAYRTPGRAASIPPRNVLISVGGGDQHHLLPRLLREVEILPSSMHLHVVVGPFVALGSSLLESLGLLEGRVSVHQGPNSMVEVISRCDVAVSAAGQTLYELAAKGRPAVGITVANNQLPQLEAFCRAGAAVSAGSAADPNTTSLAMQLLTTLSRDETQLRNMAAAGRGLIDGHGASRVAQVLLQRAAAPLSLDARV